MNPVLQMQQDKADALQAADAILKLGATRPLTVEEKATVKEKHQFVANINDTLDLQQRQAALSNIPSDRGRSSAQIHDNNLDRPFGPEPRSGETATQKKSRLTIGFGEQLLAIRASAVNPSTTDPRLLEINKRGIPAGASEQVPADGGFLVYPDYSDQILTISHETGLVYTRTNRTYQLSETANAIKVPGVDEQSRVDGSRWGGIRMYHQNEADALVGSKPKFRLIELILKKLTGLFYATDELISDARLLGTVITQGFGEETGFKLDDVAINGDGAGKGQGILSSNCLITVAKETGQAAATLLFQNVTKMWYRLYARSRKNAVWFVNQDVEQQLLQMSLAVGTGGSSVVDGVAAVGPRIYTPAGFNGNETAMLFGRPVIAIEQCQTLGTLGDIILADLSQLLMIDKGDPQQATSMHVRFLTDETTFRIVYRYDMQPQWNTALTPYNGTNTQSPFVALAAR